MTERVHLAELTTEEVAAVVAKPPSAVLLPVGSVEPHGPHLPLGTDTLLSEEARVVRRRCLRAERRGAWIAPSVPYGVTDFAAGFSGAIGVDAAALTAFLSAIAARFLDGRVVARLPREQPPRAGARSGGARRDRGAPEGARVGRVPSHEALGEDPLRRVQARQLPRGAIRDLARPRGRRRGPRRTRDARRRSR